MSDCVDTDHFQEIDGVIAGVGALHVMWEDLAEVRTLKGGSFGNIVIAASASPLPMDWLPRLMAAGPHPAKVAHGAELDAFARTARIMPDADAELIAAARAGVVGLTQALAVEWAAAGINVNAIAPGAFESEMMDGMLSRMGDIAQQFPRKRIANPAQMDSTLLFLASPASEAVTGTVIKIDDGQSPR